MMDRAISEFNTQFTYEPEIVHEDKIVQKKFFVVCGMGGSHLAADIATNINPKIDLVVYSDYGLPDISSERIQESMIILSSYSGNTEEVVEALYEVVEKKLSAIVISVGGTLIAEAKKFGLPYIQMPNTGIQPRSALGFSYLALLKAMGQDEALAESKKLVQTLQPDTLKQAGEKLASELEGKVPVIYTSRRNFSVAYNWKIKLNETGKIPAFYNVVPELNHNEMNGFDISDTTRNLYQNFSFILLTDTADHPQVIKRMQVLKKLYSDRNLPVRDIELIGDNTAAKIFTSLLLADWTAFYTATQYGLEAEQVPMVEEFKKFIKKARSKS